MLENKMFGILQRERERERERERDELAAFIIPTKAVQFMQILPETLCTYLAVSKLYNSQFCCFICVIKAYFMYVISA